MNSESLRKMKLENQSPYKQPDPSLLKTNTVSIQYQYLKKSKSTSKFKYLVALQTISKLLIYMGLYKYHVIQIQTFETMYNVPSQ